MNDGSRIAILGTGSMGSAILGGVLAAGGSTVRATARTAERLAALPSADALESRAVQDDPAANRWAVDGADVVVVAVKPYGVLDLLAEVGGALAPGAVVVSVAAGIPIARMRSALPSGVAVLRAMPNTPAAIGRGVTGLTVDDASASATARARAVFSTIGEVVEIPEARIDALSAVSGSGPAYLFLFVEQLEAAARDYGFSAEDARRLVVGTIEGSAMLLAQSGEEPAELRRRVTSPNGTTERAVGVFEERDLGGVVRAALDAAIARAAELARD